MKQVPSETKYTYSHTLIKLRVTVALPPWPPYLILLQGVMFGQQSATTFLLRLSHSVRGFFSVRCLDRSVYLQACISVGSLPFLFPPTKETHNPVMLTYWDIVVIKTKWVSVPPVCVCVRVKLSRSCWNKPSSRFQVSSSCNRSIMLMKPLGFQRRLCLTKIFRASCGKQCLKVRYLNWINIFFSRKFSRSW